MQSIELCREEPHDGEIPFEARPVGSHELKPSTASADIALRLSMAARRRCRSSEPSPLGVFSILSHSICTRAIL